MNNTKNFQTLSVNLCPYERSFCTELVGKYVLSGQFTHL